MRVLTWVLVIVAAGLASQLPLRISTPAWQAHLPKGAAQTLSSYLVLAGVGGAALAGVALLRQPSVGMAVAGLVGLGAAAIAGSYIQQIRLADDALRSAFGSGWEATIPTDRRDAMLSDRWRWALPRGPDPRHEPDVVYARLPDGRELLADVWRPNPQVEPSGLALVYVHGGYYQLLDKDSGTRPLFRHLTRQGHVVVDLGYRLVDETDIVGMVGDVKRGIAWIKDHARSLDVDPERVVVAGASSGGNLALLAAYTPGHPLLTPGGLVSDTSVRAVVSYYGVHDFPVFAQLPGDDDLLSRLLGDSYEQAPGRYELGSPVHHVSDTAPTTLLVQGLHDQPHLIDAGRDLAAALDGAGVRVANVELPATDHAFDLILGQVSAPGMAALYDLERFLAVVAHESRTSTS